MEDMIKMKINSFYFSVVPSIFLSWLGTTWLHPNTIVMRRIRNIVLRSCSRLYYPILIYSLCSGSGAGEGYDTISGEVCACPLNGTLRLSPPFLDHIIRMFPPWLGSAHAPCLPKCAAANTRKFTTREITSSSHWSIGCWCQRTFGKFHSALVEGPY